MTKDEIKKLIREEIKKHTKEIITIANDENIFHKVENMLKNYNRFKNRIHILQQELENIIIKKQVNYGIIFSNQHEHLSETEKIEIKKEEIKKSINQYEGLINLIDFGLNEIKNDKYLDIIKLKYFEKNTNEEIAEKLNIEERTVRRNKNRLVEELTAIIFPDEILKIFL